MLPSSPSSQRFQDHCHQHSLISLMSRAPYLSKAHISWEHDAPESNNTLRFWSPTLYTPSCISCLDLNKSESAGTISWGWAFSFDWEYLLLDTWKHSLGQFPVAGSFVPSVHWLHSPVLVSVAISGKVTRSTTGKASSLGSSTWTVIQGGQLFCYLL